ncbi:MAG: hypothetical protein OSB25_08510 [Salibacteraceae bacterium]|nr:hypothetical protein [Salibacteraceae bacterium]
MLSVLFVVLIHNSVPHFHNVQNALEIEFSAKNTVEHNHQHETHSHQEHEHSESIGFWAILDLLVGHHSHSDGATELTDILNDTFKNKELNQNEFQPFFTLNEFLSIVHFKPNYLNLAKLNAIIPLSDGEKLSLRGPPAIG